MLMVAFSLLIFKRPLLELCVCLNTFSMSSLGQPLKSLLGIKICFKCQLGFVSAMLS